MNLLFSSVWWKKVGQMNRSAKGFTLDGFSLANHREYAKFSTPKLSRYKLCMCTLEKGRKLFFVMDNGFEMMFLLK